MKHTVSLLFDRLFRDNPALSGEKSHIEAMFSCIAQTYHAGGKLLVAGNGGSCADAEHIVGELMKGVLIPRPIPAEIREALMSFGADGNELCSRLEGALTAISLCGHPALSTAFSNDAEPAMGFAQQVLGYGKPGDTLLVISTSGNSKNCVYAAECAKAIGMHVVAMTGANESRLSALADVTYFAPAAETYRVQEFHLPVYHALCAMLEAEFFAPEPSEPSSAQNE